MVWWALVTEGDMGCHQSFGIWFIKRINGESKLGILNELKNKLWKYFLPLTEFDPGNPETLVAFYQPHFKGIME